MPGDRRGPVLVHDGERVEERDARLARGEGRLRGWILPILLGAHANVLREHIPLGRRQRVLRFPLSPNLEQRCGRRLQEFRPGDGAIDLGGAVLEGHKGGFREGDLPTQFVGKGAAIPLQQFQAVLAHAKRDDFTPWCFLEHL